MSEDWGELIRLRRDRHRLLLRVNEGRINEVAVGGEEFTNQNLYDFKISIEFCIQI